MQESVIDVEVESVVSNTGIPEQTKNDYKKLSKEIFETQKKLAKFRWQYFTAKSLDKQFRCNAKVDRAMKKLAQLAIIQDQYKQEMSIAA